VVKRAAVAQEMLKTKAYAKVFDGEEAAVEAILGGKINKGETVIIRYEGPKGGPGMREMLTPTSALVGMGLDKYVSLITDGRFSGGTKGAAIPEASEGGPIGLVKDGDVIEIDIPAGKLELLVNRSELEERKKGVKIKEHNSKGYIGRYAKMVSSASTGAVCK
jgi:dihydroxy-acid dehydratase